MSTPLDWTTLIRPISPAPQRPRIFVSYQHSTDQAYFDAFTRIFHDKYETVFDSSLDRSIQSDNSEYVIQRIRDDFITGTSCTLVLVGATSYERKYIDWEIKATLDKEHGLIGVQLPSAPLNAEGRVVVPSRLHSNITSGYAVWTRWEVIVAGTEPLRQIVADACSKPRSKIVNPREIKKRNG